MTLFKPSDGVDAQEIIAWAAAEEQPLDIVAGGSKRRLGRPSVAEHVIDLSALRGVIDYDAAELVLTAQAATPMAEIEALLAERAQMFAFEPPDWRGLFGDGGEPTLGGTIACNLAGPRRVRAGAARDHLLGFHAINGWGDAWKSGGRVVKNVTGYDMSKLQAGAHGTLSALTELSVRVIPRPETSCTLLLHGLSDDDAIAALSRALNTQHEVSAAAHLPAAVARRVSGLAAAGAVTALRLEGPRPSAAFRLDALAAMFGDGTRLDARASQRLWAEIGAVSPLLAPSGRCVWRVCPTPSKAPEVASAVRARLDSLDAFYDWGGGLLWLSLDSDQAGDDAGAAIVREATRRAGGHATLILGSDAARAAVPVFEPEAAPLAALSARVKASFDPRRILNRGRMREGQ